MHISAEHLEQTLHPHVCGIVRRFLLNGRAVLETSISTEFQNAVYRFLSDASNCGACDSRELLPRLMNRADESHALCAQLADLGFSRVIEDAVSWVVFETIDRMVAEHTRERFDARALPVLWDTVDKFIVTWIGVVLPHPILATQLEVRSADGMDIDGENDEERGRQLCQWRKRLSFHLHISLGKIRITQMLELLDRFPRSMPALEDLKDCIRSTNLKPSVTAALKNQFTDKMLNAGTLTSDILKQYVNMIRALRFLDPSDVILESVSDPVHDYLRRRPDTVRCIVSDMTGDGELYQELERGRGRASNKKDAQGTSQDSANISSLSIHLQEEDDCLSIDGDFDANMTFDEELYKAWQPNPIDAPLRHGTWRSGGDAITTLVAIYGSSEEIVNEYKGMLADKLSTHLEVDIEREVRVLHLLTERFGRVAMHECGIMLKDFTDSMKIERNLPASTRRALRSFEATVISKEFWPNLTEEPSFKLMPELEKRMKVFEDLYKRIKNPRKLKWQSSLGAVALELEFEGGRKFEVTVSPIQATILHHFGLKKRLSLQQLQDALDVEDSGFVRRKVQGLALQGFLRVVDGSNGIYETVERGVDIDVMAGGGEEDGGDYGENGESGGLDDEAEMRVYEKYIIAMLQNLKQLPLEQVHTMLQRFVQTPVYDKSQGQLAAFLGKLVAENKIEVSAGIYRVRKSKPKG